MGGSNVDNKEGVAFEQDVEQKKASHFGRSKKIFVVEDNPINRQILCKILGDEYETIQAENGREALDLLAVHGEDVILILLDIVMPEMDGYTFLSIIKEHPIYSAIPVIVTTSNDSEEEEVKSLSAGATDFIRKPYRPQIVKHRVASIISLRETAAMVNLMKYDRLTGVYSREYFYKLAEERIHSNPDRLYDIICSDIEHFSLINDMFGHSAGNDLLRITGEICIELAGQYGLCGRLNADTFAMLVERKDEYSNEFFEEYVIMLNERFSRCRLQMDFGIYPMDEGDCTVNTACDRAMSAIETIKGKFIKNHAYYDETLRKQRLSDQAITDSMEQALEKREFVLYYQPKYSLLDENIVGVEALVRWQLPDGTLMMPGRFIPLFEKNGFITSLDRYVWEEACILLRQCLDNGDPIVPVSVNVSRADLHNPEMPEIIMGIVDQYGLSPKNLHLEITESAYTDRPDVIIDTVSRLRDAGFIIEMDDFGTGYSSLNMLNEMPIDVLKLDMKFVQNNTMKQDEKNIISFTIDLAKFMNLSITAEGAETREQVERLRDMKCDHVQGYYFSKPLPAERFVQLLRESNGRPAISET